MLEWRKRSTITIESFACWLHWQAIDLPIRLLYFAGNKNAFPIACFDPYWMHRRKKRVKMFALAPFKRRHINNIACPCATWLHLNRKRNFVNKMTTQINAKWPKTCISCSSRLPIVYIVQGSWCHCLWFFFVLLARKSHKCRHFEWLKSLWLKVLIT